METETLNSKISNLLNKNPNFNYNELKNNLKISELELEKGLLDHFSKLSKKDFHCHLGMGISKEKIISIIQKQNCNDFRKILKNLALNSYTNFRKKLIVFIISITPHVFLKNKFCINCIIKISGALRIWNNADFFIVSKTIFEETAMITLKNYIADNVNYFSIRLNPFKKHLSEKEEMVEIFIDVMNSIVNTIDKVTKNKNDKNITITLSLTRSNEKNNLHYIKEILDNWNIIPIKIKNKIKALDIAGPEGGNLEYLDEWKNIIDDFSKLNIGFSPHLGDIRNISKNNKIYEYWKKYLETKNEKFLLMLIDKHSDFVNEYIKIIPQGESIAHGISISTKIIFVHLSNYFIFDLEKKCKIPENDILRIRVLNKIQNIKQLLVKKNISIYFSPSTTLKSSNKNAFQYLPIAEWLKDNIKVKIGIDGIYQYPNKKTLSKDLKNLYITKPKYGDYLSYTQILNLIR